MRDELRDEMVPLNRKYPIAELLAACRRYPGASNARRITFEYVMLRGVNDSEADARELVRLIAGIPAKVNLIPFNPWPGSAYEPSTRHAAGPVRRHRDGGRVLQPDPHAARARHPGRLRAAEDRERQGAARRLMGRPGPPIVLLAAAGFLGSAGTRIVDSILHPIATDFGVGVADLWVVIAAFTLPYGLAQIVLGPVGDRFGKLRVILGALVLYALFTGACAWAGSLPGLTVLRACAGAASAGLIPVSMAYIGDAVPYDRRQVTLSRFLTGTVVAQTLAGPLGGVFGEYVGWRGVFVVLSGLAVLVAAGFASRIRRLPDRRGAGRMLDPANYVAMARRPAARFVLLAAALDGAVLGGCFPFLAPFLHERFELRYVHVGLILACFGVGAYAYTAFARPMLAALGEAGMVLTGGLLMVGGLLLGVLSPAWPWFVAVELMLGLGFFTLHGVLQARATEMLPNARGTAVATFACVLFVGQSLGALLIGGAIARFGYGHAFVADAGAITLLGVWLWRSLRGAPSLRHA